MGFVRNDPMLLFSRDFRGAWILQYLCFYGILEMRKQFKKTEVDGGIKMSLRTDLEKLTDEHWQSAHIKIKPLSTMSDVIYAGCDCQLTDDQKDLVNPFWFSIGRAYLAREDNYPCVIYNESNDPVGFIMFSKWLATGNAYSWSYFIDKNQQGKGYGKQAARLAVHILKNANSNMSIKLATEENNTKAQQLYVSLGFEQLSEMDGDDLVFGL